MQKMKLSAMKGCITGRMPVTGTRLPPLAVLVEQATQADAILGGCHAAAL